MNNNVMSSAAVNPQSFESLRCSTCSNYLNVAPVMTLEDINICGRCYKDEDYTDENRPIRNIPYEALIDFFPFPCIYHEQGCKDRRVGKEAAKHESVCKYREFKCPSCEWHGVVQKLVSHYEENHPDLLIKSGEIEIKTDADIETNYLVIDQEMMFVFQEKFEKAAESFWCTGYCVTAPTSNENFSLEIKFKHAADLKESVTTETPFARSFKPLEKTNALEIHIPAWKTVLGNPEKIIAKIRLALKLENSDVPVMKFLNELECPVCNLYMISPIYQCSNGHSVCSDCRQQITSCPVCRVSLDKTLRNYGLEKVVSKISYPCKFYSVGCRYMAPSSEIRAHESNCNKN